MSLLCSITLRPSSRMSLGRLRAARRSIWGQTDRPLDNLPISESGNVFFRSFPSLCDHNRCQMVPRLVRMIIVTFFHHLFSAVPPWSRVFNSNSRVFCVPLFSNGISFSSLSSAHCKPPSVPPSFVSFHSWFRKPSCPRPQFPVLVVVDHRFVLHVSR